MTELRLSNHSITGQLPASWATSLPSLTAIALDLNHLSGTLPAAWSALEHLTAVMLEDNNLQGSIPIEYSKLSELRHLYLDRNAAMCGDASWLDQQHLTANGTGIGSLCPLPPSPLSSQSPLLSAPPPSSPSSTTQPSPSEQLSGPPPPHRPDTTPGNQFVWVLILLIALGCTGAYIMWSTCQSASNLVLEAWSWTKANAEFFGWRIWGYQQLQGRREGISRDEEVEMGRTR